MARGYHGLNFIQGDTPRWCIQAPCFHETRVVLNEHDCEQWSMMEFIRLFRHLPPAELAALDHSVRYNLLNYEARLELRPGTSTQ